MASPTVSIIIPTLNGARTIGGCLHSLQAQSTRPDEILVVDCGSTDDSVAIALHHGARIIHSSRANRSYQCNVGAKEAFGDFLLFLDCDMVLSPGVIEECLVAAADFPEPRPLVIPEESRGNSFWASAKAFERSFYQGVWWLEAARWFPRELFDRLGGYDILIIGTEDWDIDERARQTATTGRIKGVIYHEEGRLTPRQMMERKAHYASSFTSFSERHPGRARLALRPSRRMGIFLRQGQRLLRHPALALGAIALGIAELSAARGWCKVDNPWKDELPFAADDVDFSGGQ